MSAETRFPPQNPAMVAEELQRFHEVGYKQTDAQFSVARTGGYDLIDEVQKKRVYVTSPGSIESESILASVLGSSSIVTLRKFDSNIAVYDLPYGARSLQKTMKTGPYAKPYMQSLALRSLQFLEKIYRLDPKAFGLSLGSIAISHDGDVGDRDDIFLTVIPPLLATTNPEVERKGIQKFIADSKTRQKGTVALDLPVVQQYKALLAGMHERGKRPDTSVLDKYFDTEQAGGDVTR